MVINSHPLYQLSYSGMIGVWECLKSGWYKYHILHDMSMGYLRCTLRIAYFRYCSLVFLNLTSVLKPYRPSCPFLSSMITSLAMAFNVSNTPVPSVATAS